MIRALLAEDSAVTREYLSWVLEEDPGITVVGAARDGGEAVELTQRLQPDVVVMDVHMPVLDGFEAARAIMRQTPTPIVMATASSSQAETRGAFQALEAGALALLGKPPAPWDERHDEAARELVRTVKLMAEVKVVRRYAPRSGNGAPPPPLPPAHTARAPRVVAVGASTGGPAALAQILGELPAGLPLPILLVQHIAFAFAPGFIEWLDSTTALTVKPAVGGERPQPGTVHVGADDCHLSLDRDGRLALDDGPPVNGFRPSITRLFESVAAVCGRAAVGVLLTGMGRDGAEGLRGLRDAGALTVAQDEASSAVFGMPGEAVRLQAATSVLAPAAIAQLLRRLAARAPR